MQLLGEGNLICNCREEGRRGRIRKNETASRKRNNIPRKKTCLSTPLVVLAKRCLTLEEDNEWDAIPPLPTKTDGEKQLER